MLKASFLFFVLGFLAIGLGVVGKARGAPIELDTGLELFFACLALAVLTFLKALTTPSRT